MFVSKKNGNTCSFEISSELAQVDRVVLELKEWLNGSEGVEVGGLALSLRELLGNAIEHGNQMDPAKKVKCKISKLKGSRYSLRIEDQGDGFNHNDIEMTMPHPNQNRQRGFALLNRFTDSFKFNEEGNCVTAYVTISGSTEYEVTKNRDGFTVITPTGDLTASSADRFRVALLDQFDNDASMIRIDLKNVSDIDSTSLNVLFSFLKRLQEKYTEKQIEIVNVNSDLWNLFNLTRLTAYCVVTI